MQQGGLETQLQLWLPHRRGEATELSARRGSGGGRQQSREDAPSVAVAVTEEAARGADMVGAQARGESARARRRPGSESALRAMLDFVAVFGVLW